MSNFIVNNITCSNTAFVYNLSEDFIYNFAIYFSPILFSTSVSGYNEVLNNKSWLLTEKENGDHKISVTIEDQTFNIKYGIAGSSPTNPIIFTQNLSQLSIQTSLGTINPLYGSNSTEYSNDWLRYYLSGQSNLSEAESLPSYNNIDRDIEYYLKGRLNLSNIRDIEIDDSLSVSVNINATYGSDEYNLIQDRLLKTNIMVHEAIIGKKITNGIELIYSNEFNVYDKTRHGVIY